MKHPLYIFIKLFTIHTIYNMYNTDISYNRLNNFITNQNNSAESEESSNWEIIPKPDST